MGRSDIKKCVVPFTFSGQTLTLGYIKMDTLMFELVCFWLKGWNGKSY